MEISQQNQIIPEIQPQQTSSGNFSSSEMISQNTGQTKTDENTSLGLNVQPDTQNIQQINNQTFEAQLNSLINPDTFDFSFDDIDFGETFSLKKEEVTEEDAKICLKIIEENKLAQLPQGVSEIINNQVTVQDVEATGGASRIMEVVQSAVEKNKPVRLDFDNNITLVLKVNDGKINAQFYPNDAIAEQYLKNNISYLKNRFDVNNIPYSNLSWGRERGREQQKERQEKR